MDDAFINDILAMIDEPFGEEAVDNNKQVENQVIMDGLNMLKEVNEVKDDKSSAQMWDANVLVNQAVEGQRRINMKAEEEQRKILEEKIQNREKIKVL